MIPHDRFDYSTAGIENAVYQMDVVASPLGLLVDWKPINIPGPQDLY